jgi:predicted RecB family nuclease
VEKAQLVQLRGLGIKNLQLLERVGIHSISSLATEDPENLFLKIGPFPQEGSYPRKAKIRIWIREAKKKVRSS